MRFDPAQQDVLFAQPHHARAYVTICSTGGARHEAGVVVHRRRVQGSGMHDIGKRPARTNLIRTRLKTRGRASHTTFLPPY
jgi:hypothetical protein